MHVTPAKDNVLNCITTSESDGHSLGKVRDGFETTKTRLVCRCDYVLCAVDL